MNLFIFLIRYSLLSLVIKVTANFMAIHLVSGSLQSNGIQTGRLNTRLCVKYENGIFICQNGPIRNELEVESFLVYGM